MKDSSTSSSSSVFFSKSLKFLITPSIDCINEVTFAERYLQKILPDLSSDAAGWARQLSRIRIALESLESLSF